MAHPFIFVFDAKDQNHDLEVEVVKKYIEKTNPDYDIDKLKKVQSKIPKCADVDEVLMVFNTIGILERDYNVLNEDYKLPDVLDAVELNLNYHSYLSKSVVEIYRRKCAPGHKIETQQKLSWAAFDTLADDIFVVDTVIDFYFEQLLKTLPGEIKEKVEILPVDFATSLIRCSTKNEINGMIRWMGDLKKDIYVIPVNTGSHYYGLVILNKEKTFFHFDSIRSRLIDAKLNRRLPELLDQMSIGIQREMEFKRITTLEQTKEENNCGMHLICNTESFIKLFIDGNAMQSTGLSIYKCGNKKFVVPF